MLISVIIPVYNSLEYLPRCMQSIEAQNIPDMEIVLVDDGSSDGSEGFCDDYKSAHENVTVIHQKNSGASAARNAGLRAAHGEYIHFVDSDDFLHEEDVYSFFIQTIAPLSPDIVFSRCRTFSPDLSEVLQEQPSYLRDGFYEGDILYDVLKNRYQLTLTSPVNKIFCREFLIRNDLFFQKGLQHEEDEWLPRVISCAKTAYFFNRFLYAARYQRPGALSCKTADTKVVEKACSKILIAVTGMAYMEEKIPSSETLSLIAEYYWNYLTDACVTCAQLPDQKEKDRIYHELENGRQFFKSCRFLKSKNKRIMGRMFQILGIRITVHLIGLRYGK